MNCVVGKAFSDIFRVHGTEQLICYINLLYGQKEDIIHKRYIGILLQKRYVN